LSASVWKAQIVSSVITAADRACLAAAVEDRDRPQTPF
jgi:hypothetical protein